MLELAHRELEGDREWQAEVERDANGVERHRSDSGELVAPDEVVEADVRGVGQMSAVDRPLEAVELKRVEHE